MKPNPLSYSHRKFTGKKEKESYSIFNRRIGQKGPKRVTYTIQRSVDMVLLDGRRVTKYITCPIMLLSFIWTEMLSDMVPRATHYKGRKGTRYNWFD